jgi:hypothetical protein
MIPLSNPGIGELRFQGHTATTWEEHELNTNYHKLHGHCNVNAAAKTEVGWVGPNQRISTATSYLKSMGSLKIRVESWFGGRPQPHLGVVDRLQPLS